MCPAGTLTCGSNCVDGTSDPVNCGGCGIKCRADQFCASSACACRPGLHDVGGACVDALTDPQHCGTANVVCASGTTCVGGSCQAPSACAAPSSYCANIDACINFRSDPLHCGRDCGSLKACRTDEICIDGTCESFSVPASCTTCPCAGNVCGGVMCCGYPGSGRAVCVDAACP